MSVLSGLNPSALAPTSCHVAVVGAATMDLFAQGASVVSVELFFPPLPENSRDVGPMRSSRFGKWGRGGEGKVDKIGAFPLYGGKEFLIAA